MPCCSSCGLPIQGHQIPMGPQCSILFDETMHASGWELECTVCLQPWSSQPRGKHVPKDCRFHHQQAQGNPVEDELEQQDEGDAHTRLSRITLENQAIKAQLSQLTELVCQLVPQWCQAPAQQKEDQAGGTPAAPKSSQLATTASPADGLPPPTWLQPEDPEGGPGPLQLLPLTHMWDSFRHSIRVVHQQQPLDRQPVTGACQGLLHANHGHSLLVQGFLSIQSLRGCPQHRFHLLSEERYNGVSMSISRSFSHMISSTNIPAWMTPRH